MKTLLIVGHPDLRTSRINAALVKESRSIEDVSSVALPCFQAGIEPAHTGDGCETIHRSESPIWAHMTVPGTPQHASLKNHREPDVTTPFDVSLDHHCPGRLQGQQPDPCGAGHGAGCL